MSKEREDFYRISTFILENGRECLANLLEVDLSNKQLLLREFIDLYQHEIYHLCYNRYPCCQCSGQLPPKTPRSRILHTEQLNKIFDKTNRIPGHNQSTRSKECCFPAKQNVTLADFDITLMRCMLINFVTNCQPGSYVRQAVDALIKLRNNVYGHAIKASLTDADFLIHQSALKVAILTISKACGKEDEMRDKLDNVYRRPLDKAMCMQYQNRLLEDIRQQQENEEANCGYFDATLDAIYKTGAWIVSKITGNNQLSSTAVQDDIPNTSDRKETSYGEYSNSNNIQGRQPYIKTEPIDTHIPLEHKIAHAVMNVLEDNRHDANNRMEPGNTIPTNDKDSTNNECVLLESEIDELKREKEEIRREKEELKRENEEMKKTEADRKRKSQTDDSDHNVNDYGQVGSKRFRRTPTPNEEQKRKTSGVTDRVKTTKGKKNPK